MNDSKYRGVSDLMASSFAVDWGLTQEEQNDLSGRIAAALSRLASEKDAEYRAVVEAANALITSSSKDDNNAHVFIEALVDRDAWCALKRILTTIPAPIKSEKERELEGHVRILEYHLMLKGWTADDIKKALASLPAPAESQVMPGEITCAPSESKGGKTGEEGA